MATVSENVLIEVKSQNTIVFQPRYLFEAPANIILASAVSHSRTENITIGRKLPELKQWLLTMVPAT